MTIRPERLTSAKSDKVAAKTACNAPKWTSAFHMREQRVYR